jgi:hypothetical protein
MMELWCSSKTAGVLVCGQNINQILYFYLRSIIMCKKLIIVLAMSFCLISTVGAETVVWDFENGNTHNFDLWSVNPPMPAADDPETAGDELMTGVGGPGGLPDAGVAWVIGSPSMLNGLLPAADLANARVDADGKLDYSLGTARIGDENTGSLNTYSLNFHGDFIHTPGNDQIATSPIVLLGEGAILTVWSWGGGSGTHAPAYDADEAMMYTDGSSGIAVLSAEEDDMYAILETIHTQGKGTLTEDTLDLSAYAGKKIMIDVVDAFQGSWGWLAIDEIQITNATARRAAFVVSAADLLAGFDQAQTDRLESLGYSVTVVESAEVGSTFTIDDCNAHDLLLVSESIGSSAADPLIGTTTPIMHNEAYGWDNWFFMGVRTDIRWAAGTEVEIVNDTHPIVADANVSLGMLPFFDPQSDWTTELVSMMAPGAELLAKINVDGNDYAIIFAIEAGAELSDGSAAPARSVGFSLPGQATMAPDVMTDEAWALWDASIAWLVPPPPPPTAAMIVSAADLAAGFDQAQHDALASMGYEVIVVPVADVGSVFTIDDADAIDLVLVSESIGSSGADPLIGTTTPVMHNESYGWDNWLLTTKTKSAWVNVTDVDIVDATLGAAVGPMAFFTAETGATSELVSALAPGAVNVAQVTSDANDFTIVFLVDEGAELADGSASPNRIAGFSLPGQATQAPEDLTDDAWALWEATIAWLDQD